LGHHSLNLPLSSAVAQNSSNASRTRPARSISSRESLFTPDHSVFGNHQHRVNHVQKTITFLDVLAAMPSYSPIDFSPVRVTSAIPGFGDGAFQIVSNIITHLFDLCDQGLNAVEHLIEGDGKLIDLIPLAFDRNSLFQGPSSYLLRRAE